MIDRNTIDQIKASWQQILGADKTGKGAVCPICGSGSGKKGTGVSPVPGTDYTLKCFACGASGDVINLICQKFGWSDQADFHRALEYCANAAGINVDFSNSERSLVMRKDGTVVKEAAPEDAFDPQLREECKLLFRKWNSQLKETDYWEKRGLSFETVDYFNCGFEPEWKHPNWSQNVAPTPRFIIPNSPISYLARDTRPIADLDDFWKEKTKVKYNRQGIFNFKAVSDNIIFIVEGEIDAMSLYEVGFHSVIGLGSISMVDKFIAMLDRDFISKAIKQFPQAAIIALDNETAKPVQVAKAKLIQKLNERGINTLDGTEMSGECKDPNEMLLADRDQLKANCQRLFDQAKKLPKLPMGFVPTDAEAKHEAKPLGDGKKDKTTKATLVLSGTDSTRKVLPDCPVDYNIPSGYVLSEDGLIVGDELIASRNAVIPIGFIINHHSKQQKIEIAIRRLAMPNVEEYKWDNIIVDTATIADKSKIIELTNRGLMTTAGEPAAGVVKFLFDMIAMNAEQMPVREQFDQPGWDSQLNQFRMPYLYTYYMPELEPIYCTRGSSNDWWDFARPLLERPIGALCIATAFAAPILRIIGQRSFCLYLYGSSKAGKSAIQKFAISAFGNPNKIMGTFNATMNGIEAMCVRSNDLPLLIDESTVANPSFSGEKLSYIVSGEQQRVRMNRDMTQRPMKYWRLTMMMNGEGRMFDDNSREGAMNRMLEIALEPNDKIFDDEVQARACHLFANEHYGAAGHDFIETLLFIRKEVPSAENMKVDEDGHYSEPEDFYTLKAAFRYFFDELKKANYPTYGLEQLSMLAVLATTYFAIRHYIFRDEKKAAVKYAFHYLINKSIKRIPTAEELTEDRRGWKAFVEYLQARPLQFYGEHHRTPQGEKKTNIQMPVLGERLGDYFDASGPDANDSNYIIDLSEVRVLPSAAKDILEKLGFNPAKLLHIFAEHGWIEKDKEGKNPKVRWAGSNGKQQRMIVIKGDNFTTEV